MGLIPLPSSGKVYVDTQIVIYTVQSHPIFASLLEPFWTSVDAGQLTVYSSQLALMECLVLPLREQRADLVEAYKIFFERNGVESCPVTLEILQQAAQLRADFSTWKTPDSIHAAIALVNKCSTILTNDLHFRNLPDIDVLLLQA